MTNASALRDSPSELNRAKCVLNFTSVVCQHTVNQNGDNSSFHNCSAADLQDTSDSGFRVAIIVCYFATFLVGFTGNTLVIYGILRFRSLLGRPGSVAIDRIPDHQDTALSGYSMEVGRPARRSVADYFLLNLAVADLSYVIFLPLFCWATYADQWPFHGLLADASCKMAYVARDVTKYASVFTLVGISVMQCMASRSGLPHFCEQRSTLLQGKRVCISIWLVCAVFSVHYFIFVKTRTYDGMGGKLSCLIDWPQQDAYLYSWTFFQLFVGLLIPSGAIFILYGVLFHRLKSRPQLRHFTYVLRRTVFVVALLYTVCNAPYHVLILAQLYPLGGRSDWCPSPLYAVTMSYLNAGAQVLAFVPSCSNPILYGILNDRYRNLYRAMLQKTCLLTSDAQVATSGSDINGHHHDDAPAILVDDDDAPSNNACCGKGYASRLSTNLFKLRFVTEFHAPPTCSSSRQVKRDAGDSRATRKSRPSCSYQLQANVYEMMNTDFDEP